MYGILPVMAERKDSNRIVISGPTVEAVGRGETLYGFSVTADSDEGVEAARELLGEFASHVGGQLLTEENIESRKSEGASFTTGFGGKHPNRATWAPSGDAWRKNRHTDD